MFVILNRVPKDSYTVEACLHFMNMENMGHVIEVSLFTWLYIIQIDFYHNTWLFPLGHIGFLISKAI